MSRYADLLALGAVIAVASLFFWVQQPVFGKLSVIGDMVNSRADLVVLAVAMTFVLLVGEIDLSVGSILALCSVVFGEVFVRTGSVWPATAASLAAGTLCGAANGLLTVGLRIPSFVVTLGMMEIARGLALYVAYSVSDRPRQSIDKSLAWLSDPLPGLASLPAIGTMRLSGAIVLAVAVAAVAHLTLRYTVFGRHAQAIGDNARAFELSGGRVGWRKVAIFALTGLAAAVAALMQTARLNTTDPQGGVAMELAVIAAVVVGGTSLSGGRASVAGTLLGCLLIAVLGTGLSILNTGDVAKRISTGCVILFAVLLDAWRRRRTG